MLDLEGQEAYSEEVRTRCLKQITRPEVTSQLQRLYRLLDRAVRARKEAREQMLRLGERYPEIEAFQQVPGVGPIGSHLFDAFIQTPHRFLTRQKLWSYCQLSIRSQSSDGKSPPTASPSDTRNPTPTGEAS